MIEHSGEPGVHDADGAVLLTDHPSDSSKSTNVENGTACQQDVGGRTPVRSVHPDQDTLVITSQQLPSVRTHRERVKRSAVGMKDATFGFTLGPPDDDLSRAQDA